MDRGVGQGRREGRLAEAHAAEGLSGIAKEVCSGADILLVGPQQTDEQGLRNAVRQRRNVRLRSHDSSNGEAVGTCLRVSRQFLERLSGNSKVAPFRAPTSLRN